MADGVAMTFKRFTISLLFVVATALVLDAARQYAARWHTSLPAHGVVPRRRPPGGWSAGAVRCALHTAGS
jgi:hypothetical protein